MKILWIPHCSWTVGRHQRDQYFIEYLAANNDIHVALWENCPKRSSYLNPMKHLASLNYYSQSHQIAQHSIKIHHLPRVLDIFHRWRNNPAQHLSINQRLFQRSITRIVREQEIDIVICGSNAHHLGYPPSLPVPIIFDFLDGSIELENGDYWWQMEEKYFQRSAGVLCVSQGMVERVLHRGRNAIYLPNGADLQKIKQADGESIRKRLGLTNRKVLSLIGLTCSERDYFIRAIEKVREQDPSVAFLLVGQQVIAKRLMRQVTEAHKEHVIYAGEIPYTDIMMYFAASDVGLYPVEEEPYYHNAMPIKVLEYGAAGKFVVAPRLQELLRLNLPHVLFAPPTINDFANAIQKALNQPKSLKLNLQEFDWPYLAERLESFLNSIVN